jgi:putative MATE family efflux protein
MTSTSPATPVSRAVHPALRALATLRELVNGAPVDGTRGPIGSAVLLMAVPTVMEMALEAVLAIVDMFWVSRIGEQAVAVVGVTESLYAPVYALGMGLSIGTTAVVARRIGEADADGAARTASNAIAIACAAGALVAVVGLWQARPLLELLGADSTVASSGTSYARVMLAGSVAVLLLFVLNAASRAAGEPARAMKTLLLANGINVVLAPLLIYGPGPLPAYGVAGAAIATVVSRGLGVAYQLSHLLIGTRSPLRIRRRHWRPQRATLHEISLISSVGVLQVFVMMGSWALVVRIVASFGSAALAGYTVATRVLMFVLFPCWGLASAAAALVGQNLGSGQPERARQSATWASHCNTAYLFVTGLLMAAFSGPIADGFLKAGPAHESAVACLQILGLSLFTYGYGSVMTQAFNGAGDPWTPTLVQVLAFWVIELPIAYMLSHWTPLHERGAFVAIAVGFVALTVSTFVALRSRQWQPSAQEYANV